MIRVTCPHCNIEYGISPEREVEHDDYFAMTCISCEGDFLVNGLGEAKALTPDEMEAVLNEFDRQEEENLLPTPSLVAETKMNGTEVDSLLSIYSLNSNLEGLDDESLVDEVDEIMRLFVKELDYQYNTEYAECIRMFNVSQKLNKHDRKMLENCYKLTYGVGCGRS